MKHEAVISTTHISSKKNETCHYADSPTASLFITIRYKFVDQAVGVREGIAEQFPEQKFIVLDGYLKGNDAIHTMLYNQMEQSYMIGHMGGLITTSSLPGANADLKAGLIAGQEYPIMNRVIKVGYEMGLETLQFVVV